MESKKSLIAAIVSFLRSESQSVTLTEEAAEGLGVSIELLEQAYGLDETVHSNENLLDIYERFNAKNQESTNEDKIAADEQKLKGNNLMKEDRFEEAIACYTNAIELDGRNAVYYCNRAAAYTKIDRNVQAIADCTKAIEIDPYYGKAYGRMGLAYLSDKNYMKAVEMYEKAVELEPSNSSYQSNLNLAREQNKQTQPEQRPTQSNPLAGLDISSLLSNPAVMNMAQNFMQNPAMQNMFANMMGGAPPPPTGRLDADAESANGVSGAPPANPGGIPGGFQLPAGLDLGNIMNATQMMADQIRTQDPNLADSLREQFQQGQHPPDSSDDTEKQE